MKIAGKRKERDITFHADGALLKEGALFNTEMQEEYANLAARCWPCKTVLVTLRLSGEFHV